MARTNNSLPQRLLHLLVIALTTWVDVDLIDSFSWLPEPAITWKDRYTDSPTAPREVSLVDERFWTSQRMQHPMRFASVRGGSIVVSEEEGQLLLGFVTTDSNNTLSAFIVPTFSRQPLNAASRSWQLSPMKDAVIESMALICDVIVVIDIKNKVERFPSLPVTALTRGIDRRIDAGLGKGRLVIVSPGAKNQTWVQKEALSEAFSWVTPSCWEVFDFCTPSQLVDLATGDLARPPGTLNFLFKDANDKDLPILFPQLLDQLVKSIDSQITEFSLEEILFNDTLELFLDDDFDKIEMNNAFTAIAPTSIVTESTDDAVVENSDTYQNLEIQQVLAEAHEQLEELESKMEEVGLQQQSEAKSMPLLDFGTSAQKIMEETENRLRIMEEKGQVSTNLHRGLTNGVKKRVQLLYTDHLQSLRNYYGQRYESILEAATISKVGSNDMDLGEQERQWTSSAQHMIEGFQAAARNAIPAMFRNSSKHQKDFDHADALEGLIKDMMEATQRAKDEQSISDMALDVEDDDDAASLRKQRRIRVPKWLGKIAARAFVFGVNYLQGWLAWQGIKRAALERDRDLPKFPLF